MAYTQEQKEAFIKEIFDGDQKVTLVCGKHNYSGVGAPYMRCPDCWKVYFINDYAKTPPHLRGQRLEDLQAVVHHMVEEAEAGKFDFTPFASPIIKIDRED